MAPIITISNGDHVNGHHIDQVPLGSQSDQQLCNIITPVVMLSYGFEENAIREELEHLKTTSAPTALILDSGSTDSGPTKLALGTMTSPRSSYERDLRKLLSLTHDYHIPLIISSAGGDGQNAHVDEFLNIIQEICDEPGNGYVSYKEIYHSLMGIELINSRLLQFTAMYQKQRSSKAYMLAKSKVAAQRCRH
jgi:hypothetical protein